MVEMLLLLSERLTEVPWWLGLVGRGTAWLILAWGVHGFLGYVGCNPRWRVAHWRWVAVGLVGLTVLSVSSPIVTWRLPRVEASRKPVIVADPHDRPPIWEVAPASRLSSEVAAVSASREVKADEVPAQAGVSVTLGPWLLRIWLVGVVLLTGRVLWNTRRIASVVQCAHEAPEEVIAEAQRIAVRLGVTRTVRVLSSSEVRSPVVVRVWQPTLLMPARFCDRSERGQWPSVLAHELAHVRGHDLVWNSLWHLTSLVLWCHPLVWKVREAHAAACDRVCDAVAAELLGDVASYVRTLARLALQAADPPPALGLTMARTSDVRRRIEALEGNVLAPSLLWRLTMPVLAASGLLAFLLGGLRFALADPVEETKGVAPPAIVRLKAGAPDQGHWLTMKIVDEKTRAPLENVSVFYSAMGDQNTRNEVVQTGKDGLVSFKWLDGVTIRGVRLKVIKSGYVGVQCDWDDRMNLVRLPETKELRLESGFSVGGVVQDDEGHPIAGATVELNATLSDVKGSGFTGDRRTVKSDEQGRWQFQDAPRNLARVHLSGAHPDYCQWTGNATRVEGREIRIVLTRGLTIRGRVVNVAGEPVKGAEAIISNRMSIESGWDRCKTDERGEFVIKGCDPRPVPVIFVHAKGFAPGLHEIQMTQNGEAAMPEFRLEPGAALRVKVVDQAGKPISGVYCQAEVWREVPLFKSWRTDKTDAEGRFLWNDAPSDAVLFQFFCDGYMAEQLVPLVASDKEHVVVLRPELKVSGRVTDAMTGHPIAKFRVHQGFSISDKELKAYMPKEVREILEDAKRLNLAIGQPRFRQRDSVSWSSQGGAEAELGVYSTRFSHPRQAHYIRIDAPGYKQAISRPFRPDEGRQTQDFSLVRE